MTASVTAKFKNVWNMQIKFNPALLWTSPVATGGLWWA